MLFRLLSGVCLGKTHNFVLSQTNARLLSGSAINNHTPPLVGLLYPPSAHHHYTPLLQRGVVRSIAMHVALRWQVQRREPPTACIAAVLAAASSPGRQRWLSPTALVVLLPLNRFVLCETPPLVLF